MEKPTSEPEGGFVRQREIITTIKAQSNCGGHWAVKLSHNGNEHPIPKDGLKIHINGGAVYIKGIDVTRQVQKGVENIFTHDSWSGKLKHNIKE